MCFKTKLTICWLKSTELTEHLTYNIGLLPNISNMFKLALSLLRYAVTNGSKHHHGSHGNDVKPKDDAKHSVVVIKLWSFVVAKHSVLQLSACDHSRRKTQFDQTNTQMQFKLRLSPVQQEIMACSE